MLNIKPTHKPIQNYYAELKQLANLGAQHEGAVRVAFQNLLQHYATLRGLTLICEKTRTTPNGNNIRIDGEIVTDFGLIFGHWEAKDLLDELSHEAQQKLTTGYPAKNIIFQTPHRAILYQNGTLVLDLDITERQNLIHLLQTFFAYTEENLAEWDAAVNTFQDTIPELGAKLETLIQTERQNTPAFREAFAHFHQQCRDAINPNLAEAEVERMLAQHLMTEQIFATVFDNRDFTRRNVIAREIEKVIDVLTQHALNRSQFFRELQPFYEAIEKTASTLTDFSQKQDFLNTLYQRFFQDFSTKDADRHGVVYTPQPIVDFMVNSVQHILKTHFGKSLADTGVHIIDPFVGTGNFIVRLMQDIPGIALDKKYKGELHCNEVMLLPYYIASMNIEHAYYEKMGRYEPFKHICFVDTFDTFGLMDAPNQTGEFAFLTAENTLRVEEQRDTPMFVVIGNPPYNASQANENDNNQNRPHEAVDNRVRATYAAASSAQLKSKLYDPYVKSLRWASDKIGPEGIIAFITNNSFIDGKMFDGMRQCLAEEFDILQILDLGGNIRKGQPGDSNVFGIQVGVSINFLVKTGQPREGRARILYTDEAAALPKERTFQFLAERAHVGTLKWREITPTARQMWLTEGLAADFDTFIPMGTKAAKAAKGEAEGTIFKTYSLGVSTSRDAWVYNFNEAALQKNMTRMIEFYNAETSRWERRTDLQLAVNDFVNNDRRKIKWTDRLKAELEKGTQVEFSPEKIRTALDRPFTKKHLYFDRLMNQRVYVMPSIFPTSEAEQENRVLCVNLTQERPFTCLMANCIPSSVMAGGFGCPTQCFPFYTYNEDGSNRRENITDWALSQFRAHYADETITKWDIFHYNYAVLHHSDYRETYQVNLKHDLPHIPFAPEFWQFVEIGRALANLHVNYEQLDVLPNLIETPPLNWRVEKMALSKDKTSLRYNESLTVADIPSEVFDYRLGTRSALEWVIDRYRVKPDPNGSGIIANPNGVDAQYIVRLVGQVMHVSQETVRLVGELPPLFP
ncbi:DNA helicase [Candidatus Poribacteria bacterium]|nr:MAG: DNA helicase [Candidatus Poribacteria bacterium]